MVVIDRRGRSLGIHGRILHVGIASGDVLGVILAAGAGTRFTAPGHKLRQPLGDRPVFSHALGHMLESGIGHHAVVTGAVDLGDLLGDTTELHNDQWRTGQLGSVRIALEHARRLGVEVVVFGLGDQPFLEPEAWWSVAIHPTPIAVATYGGRRGHPVAIHREMWDVLDETATDPDSGLRDVMRLRPDDVGEVACKGNPADIDTPEDLAKWS